MPPWKSGSPKDAAVTGRDFRESSGDHNPAPGGTLGVFFGWLRLDDSQGIEPQQFEFSATPRARENFAPVHVELRDGDRVLAEGAGGH